MAANSPNGYRIGTIDVMAPTYADDMVLMTSAPLQLQALLHLVAIYTNEDQYVIYPQKTVILPFNVPSEEQLNFLKSDPPWSTNGNAIPVEEEMIHLGIKCSIREQNVVVNYRTSTARKTFYAMNGSGVYS